MTIEEAEIYFKKYDGHYFHMGREESMKRCREFKELDIPETTIEKWRQEIIAHYFNTMFDDLKDVWRKLLRAIDVISETETDHQNNGERLLDSLSRMNDIDVQQKILVIETIADHNCRSFIRRKTDLTPRLNELMSSFIDIEFDPDDFPKTMGWENIQERYDSAVKDYKHAYDIDS